MVAAENIRQSILILIDILELIHHNVFQTMLPLFPYLPAVLQNVKSKIHQVVKIQRKALSLFVIVLIQDLVLERRGAAHQLQQRVHIRVNEGFHIPPAALAPADIIDGLLNGDIPPGDPQILEDGGQNRLFVLLIHHQKRLGIAHHVAVLFQKAYAEAMKGCDPGQILIRKLGADPLFHFSSCLIGEGHTEDIGGGNAKHIH